MGIKFDGTYVKNGSKVVANMKRTDELKDGTSSGGKTLGNIKRRDEIKDGSSSGGKTLCNVKDGKNIRDGSSSSGRTLIKISDAAKQIGTSATGPSTALVWWFFAKKVWGFLKSFFWAGWLQRHIKMFITVPLLFRRLGMLLEACSKKALALNG